jgi:uncharacterized glyoxalase superfamily protein PhnB
MSKREISRVDIINNLINGKINGTDASKQIGVSVRHIKRLKFKVKKHGAEGLIHGNRGRDSNRKIDHKIVKKAEKHLKEKYYDFGPTFAAEKLDEIHNIKLGKETVRGMMTDLELWKPKPKKQSKKRHVWRARKDNYGEMEQFDGSYHVWFGDEESCLLLSVDDATGKITHAKFDINESVMAVFGFWKEYVLENGLPLSIYLDKFSTYKINHKNAVDNKDMITQFERAMNQIGVKPITAHSPQAKGRVERIFETLQDRLVKELRLAGITTIEGANEFLKTYIPKFDDRFAVVPKRKSDLHKKTDEQTKEKLDEIFSVQNIRKVNNDYTIRFNGQYFQLDQEQAATVYKKDAVIVEEHLSGKIELRLKNSYLNYTVLPERPKKEINVKLAAITRSNQSHYKPPADHPWRRQFLFNRSKNGAVERVLTPAMKSA